MSIKSRLSKLEAVEAAKNPPSFHVQIVEITDDMRQAQREAHARGEKYYIIELSDSDTYSDTGTIYLPDNGRGDVQP